MSDSMGHQKRAVASGHWPLFRYKPGSAEPFQLDSKAPSIPFSEFARTEARFAMLYRSDPQRAKALLARSEADIAERWRYYEQLAGVKRAAPQPDPGDSEPEKPGYVRSGSGEAASGKSGNKSGSGKPNLGKSGSDESGSGGTRSEGVQS